MLTLSCFVFFLLFLHVSIAPAELMNSLSQTPTPDKYDRRLLDVLRTVTPGKVIEPPEHLNITRRRTPKGLYIGIVTLLIGNLSPEKLPGLFGGIQGFECYARRNGYTLVAHRKPFPELEGLPTEWGKMFAIIKYLPYFDWVFWLDADIVIKRPEIRAEVFINGKDLSCADAPDGNNNGAFIMKNSQWTLDFMKRWFSYRNSIDLCDNGPWMEALLSLVHEHNQKKYDGECVRRAGGKHLPNIHGYVNCYNQILAEMGSPVGARKHPHINFVYATPYGGFNSGRGWAGKNAYKPGNFQIHFAGNSAEGKEKLMLEEMKPEWKEGKCEADVPDDPAPEIKPKPKSSRAGKAEEPTAYGSESKEENMMKDSEAVQEGNAKRSLQTQNANDINAGAVAACNPSELHVPNWLYADKNLRFLIGTAFGMGLVLTVQWIWRRV